MDTVARNSSGNQWGEAGPETVAPGYGPADLTQLYGPVGRFQRRRKIDGHLVLLRPVLRQIGFRLEPVCPQGADEFFAKDGVAAQRAQGIGVAAALFSAFQVELMLEAGEDAQPHLILEFRQGTAEERSQATLPVHAIQCPHLTQQPMLHWRAVAKVQHDVLAIYRYQMQVTQRAEGRLGNSPEAVDHDVGRSPADTEASSFLQISGREALASHLPGDVRIADVD